MESSSTRDATWVVHVPAIRAEPVPVKSANETLAVGCRRVLVMDDQPEIRELAAEALAYLGYDVETAADGPEAIALYQRALKEDKPFGVVILDLTIPGGMGGREVARHILKMDPKAKLVVASGYCTDPVMENHQAYGFCAMLRKPYTLGEMSQTLLDVMARD